MPGQAYRKTFGQVRVCILLRCPAGNSSHADTPGGDFGPRLALAQPTGTNRFLTHRRNREINMAATLQERVQELVPEEWLSDNPDFTLLYQEGKAQVWGIKTRIKD